MVLVMVVLVMVNNTGRSDKCMKKNKTKANTNDDDVCFGKDFYIQDSYSLLCIALLFLLLSCLQLALMIRSGQLRAPAQSCSLHRLGFVGLSPLCFLTLR